MYSLRNDDALVKSYLDIYKSRFFYLLAALVLYFLGTASLHSTGVNNFMLSVLFSLIILSCTYIISHGKVMVLSTLTLGIILFILHWEMVLTGQNSYLFTVSYLLTAVFLTIVSYTVIRSVTQHKEITVDSLFGAICGYLLVGFTWTFIYLLIAAFNPTAFSNNMFGTSLHNTIQHFFYYSFTAMTTLGYGDILPLSNLARTCSWLEAVTGQIYLAVWISQLVGMRIVQKNGGPASQ